MHTPPMGLLLMRAGLLQAEMGVYPFMFGTAKDFEPIVQDMVQVSEPSSSPRSRR